MDSGLTKYAVDLSGQLHRAGLIMATAESCTGGWVAKVLTDIIGSSEWFDCSFVTYSNQAKQSMLGVKSQTLEMHGAVSEAVVREMVTGALARSRADLALSVSGIAGPGGGSPEKPVGTVWFAWQRAGMEAVTACRHFQGDREEVRHQAVVVALRGALELVTPSDARPGV